MPAPFSLSVLPSTLWVSATFTPATSRASAGAETPRTATTGSTSERDSRVTLHLFGRLWVGTVPQDGAARVVFRCGPARDRLRLGSAPRDRRAHRLRRGRCRP